MGLEVRIDRPVHYHHKTNEEGLSKPVRDGIVMLDDYNYTDDIIIHFDRRDDVDVIFITVTSFERFDLDAYHLSKLVIVVDD